MRRRDPSKLGLGAPPRQLTARLDEVRILRQLELSSLLRTFQHEWKLAQGVNIDGLITWLLNHTRLRQLLIHSEIHGDLTRYVWGDTSSLEVASSLTSRTSYFCHATAASIHGLLTYNPETIFINREQTTKPPPGGSLSQEGVDRAFAKKQRMSRDAYYWGSDRAVILNGKNSGRFAVTQLTIGSPSIVVDVTELERTLIDITVRPDYSGGPTQVIEAFRRAQGRLSARRLIEVLGRLQYRYPYHQALGFYLQRAGYGEDYLSPLREMGSSVTFYVGYGIATKAFDREWNVYHPTNL